MLLSLCANRATWIRSGDNEYDTEGKMGKSSWYPSQSGQTVAESGLCREGMREPIKSAKESTKASAFSNPRESIRSRGSKMRRVAVDHQIYIAALPRHLASLAFEQCS